MTYYSDEYDELTCTEQRDREEELLYVWNITDASRVCLRVFQLTEIVNAYVLGLHKATRERYKRRSHACNRRKESV